MFRFLQKGKNLRGNNMLKFVLRAVEAAIDSETKFFVENHDGSWIWRQRDELSWDRVNKLGGLDDFRTDYCRFGTAWRKRTTFRTNLHIGGQKVMCKRSLETAYQTTRQVQRKGLQLHSIS